MCTRKPPHPGPFPLHIPFLFCQCARRAVPIAVFRRRPAPRVPYPRSRARCRRSTRELPVRCAYWRSTPPQQGGKRALVRRTRPIGQWPMQPPYYWSWRVRELVSEKQLIDQYQDATFKSKKHQKGGVCGPNRQHYRVRRVRIMSKGYLRTFHHVRVIRSEFFHEKKIFFFFY